MGNSVKKLTTKGRVLKVNDPQQTEEAAAASKRPDYYGSPIHTEDVDGPPSEVYRKREEMGKMFTLCSRDQHGRLWPVPAGFMEALQSDLEVREDDTYLVTFPKCGTSWITEIVDGIKCKGDFNQVAERRKAAMMQMPRLEILVSDTAERIKLVNDLPSPRTIVTHLSADTVPQDMLKKKCKTLVLMRNPKDVLVSYYHFHKMNANFGKFDGDFATFFEAFVTGKLFYGDVFDYQLGWWAHRREDNVMIIFYEKMKKDLAGHVSRIATFLGYDSLTESELASVVENTTFDKQKQNCHEFFSHIPVFDQSVSHFFRRGEVGDWANTLTVQQNRYLDQLILARLGQGQLKFIYE